MLVPGRRTDLGTTHRPQSLPSRCEKRGSWLASVLVLGGLGASWLLGRQEGVLAKGKALLDLVKFKLPSGNCLAFPTCEAKVTGLPETTVLGSPGPRRPPWRDKKRDLHLLLQVPALVSSHPC